METYGAVQFNAEEAKKSLMNYSMIERNGDAFTFQRKQLHDGDWLITDQNGKTVVCDSQTFENQYKREGKLICEF